MLITSPSFIIELFSYGAMVYFDMDGGGKGAVVSE